MAPTISRKQRVYVETESSYGAGPGTANGSAMLLVPVDGRVSLKSTKNVLETEWQMGKNARSRHVMGRDVCELTLSHCMRGLVSDAGDGETPSTTDDTFGVFLSSAFGAGTSETGEGDASSGHTSTQIRIDATPTTLGVMDLIAYQTGSGNMQWRRITAQGNGAGTNDQLTVHRAWTSNPAGSGVAYGYRWWQPEDGQTAKSLAFAVCLDDTFYELEGCRPSSFSIEAVAGQKVMCNWNFIGSTYTENTSTLSSLDGDHSDSEYLTGGASPIIANNCTFAFNGTEYATKSMKIEFGLKTAIIDDVNGSNGLSNIMVLMTDPVITVEPLYALAWDTAFRAGTAGDLTCMFGSGVSSGGVVNACCFDAAEAQIISLETQDDNNRMRQAVQFKLNHAGSISTVSHRYWTFARA